VAIKSICVPRGIQERHAIIGRVQRHGRNKIHKVLFAFHARKRLEATTLGFDLLVFDLLVLIS
jgi:hypothetical protein